MFCFACRIVFFLSFFFWINCDNNMHTHEYQYQECYLWRWSHRVSCNSMYYIDLKIAQMECLHLVGKSPHTIDIQNWFHWSFCMRKWIGWLVIHFTMYVCLYVHLVNLFGLHLLKKIRYDMKPRRYVIISTDIDSSHWLCVPVQNALIWNALQ